MFNLLLKNSKESRFVSKNLSIPGRVFFENRKIEPKELRLSNNEGNIVLSYDESLPDSIKTSLSAAKKIWESKIPTTQPIFIYVSFEPLDDDTSMEVEVTYCGFSEFDGCPRALVSQKLDQPYGSTDSPDGIIVLNSNVDWNCSFSDDFISGYNLPTMVLKGIARCLGFGASVKVDEDTNEFIYYNSTPTFFDRLLFLKEGKKELQEIPNKSTEMADFVTSDDVYVHASASDGYKMYAPAVYEPFVSLCYFDNDSSLMSYTLGQGNTSLSIDDMTLDVLRTIGWDLPQTTFSIACNNISENGIGSSYEPHTFTILRGVENITDLSWKFFLKNKSGDYNLFSTGESESFTIPKISSSEPYFVNINGDMEGRIECDYTLDGIQYSAIPFKVFLELKPSILSISNLNIVNNDNYEFSMNFDVSYAGADYITVQIEEEFSTNLRTYRFDEPYIAHVKTGFITNLYYSWVTVLVSNKYGTTSQTLEFAPTYGVKGSEDVNETYFNSNHFVDKINLYNIDGTLVFKGSASDFQNSVFNSGVYLKEELYENGLSKISKVFLK